MLKQNQNENLVDLLCALWKEKWKTNLVFRISVIERQKQKISVVETNVKVETLKLKKKQFEVCFLFQQ